MAAGVGTEAERVTTARERERSPSERLLLFGYTVTVAALAFQVATTLAALVALGGRADELFDATDEGGVWTWASSVATFAGGFAATVHALAVPHARRRMILLAAVLVVFSLDDSAVLHEHAGERLTEELDAPDYAGARLWVVVFPPVLAAAAWALWRTAREDLEARLPLLAGLALLVAAVVLEPIGIATNWLEEERGISWPHTGRSLLEETLELGGWLLVATGLTVAMVRAVAGGGSSEA
jgi:hypothetical protein